MEMGIEMEIRTAIRDMDIDVDTGTDIDIGMDTDTDRGWIRARARARVKVRMRVRAGTRTSSLQFGVWRRRGEQHSTTLLFEPLKEGHDLGVPEAHN